MSRLDAPPLSVHPFVRGMADEHIARLSEVTRYIAVPARYRLFEEGGRPTGCGRRGGPVALDLQMPGHGPLISKPSAEVT